MMIKAIKMLNFRLFQDVELPLERLTVLIGANGTGKSTALQAIGIFGQFESLQYAPNYLPLVPVGQHVDQWSMNIEAIWQDGATTSFEAGRSHRSFAHLGLLPADQPDRLAKLATSRIFSFIPEMLASNVQLVSTLELEKNGSGLPAVLTTLQDRFPERFDSLNRDLHRWLPEFDRILLDTPQHGFRNFMLRTKSGGYPIASRSLSDGTLLSVALLTLCHLPNPPAIVGIEEPDRGIHPRLLRDVKDSLIRLTQPELFGDDRPPVQVVLTTHSPYLVDLFSDQLESIVVSHKTDLWATLTKLTDLPDVEEIVKGASLGQAWYSGILGGVPAHT